MSLWKNPRRSGGPRAKASRPKGARPRWFFGLLLGLFALLLWLELRDARIDLEARQGRIEAAWGVLEQDLAARGALAEQLAEHGGLAVTGSPSKDWKSSRHQLQASLHALSEADGRAARVEANLRVERALRGFIHALQSETAVSATPEILRLQEQILAVEHRLAQHRTDYNEAVQRFNTSLAIFPANLAGHLYGIARDPHYLPTDLKAAVPVPPPNPPLPPAPRAAR